jgi:hypothetical protein
MNPTLRLRKKALQSAYDQAIKRKMVSAGARCGWWLWVWCGVVVVAEASSAHKGAAAGLRPGHQAQDGERIFVQGRWVPRQPLSTRLID